MKRTSVTVIAVWATLLWVGVAHAQRFETHATNSAVPKGTVYDTKTKLLWEKKSPAGTGDVHDVNNTYTWSASGSAPAGTAFTSFLETLNGGDYYDPSLGLVVNSNPTSCFANYCDWRLPSIPELQGIVDLSAPGCSSGKPCIYPIFGPTQSGFYWSATTGAGVPLLAWDVDFTSGDVSAGTKTANVYVRAVRSGL